MYSCNSPSAPRCLPVSMLYRGACLCLCYIEVPACVCLCVCACRHVCLCACASHFSDIRAFSFCSSTSVSWHFRHPYSLYTPNPLSPPPFPWASTLPSPFLFPSASPPVPASLSLPEPCRQDNLGCNLDVRSLHGGCDVIRGDKWAANYWIANKL
jgi:hypothetical protein